MSLSPEPSRFKVEEIRLAGWQMQFHCIDCKEQVTEAGYFQAHTMPESARFYLRCHGRSTMVDLPMRLFFEMPRWRPESSPHNVLRFVAGFHGTWNVRIREYTDWLLKEPRLYLTAAGAFEQEQLASLFEFQMLGGYHLDSELFNIVNLEYNFEFPAEFWFPTAWQRIFAKQSGLQV
jgi:hypothetical protein